LSSELGNSFKHEVLAGNEQTLYRPRSARITSLTRKTFQQHCRENERQAFCAQCQCSLSCRDGRAYERSHSRYCDFCSQVRSLCEQCLENSLPPSVYCSSFTKPNRLMLFGETVAVYCENHTNTQIQFVPVRKHITFPLEPNRLMPFGKTAAVYCENHTEHTDTVRTSQETHYVSTTELKRLMLFGGTVAVYCEKHTEHTDSPYLTGNTLRLR
jgi:hypothetical protein